MDLSMQQMFFQQIKEILPPHLSVADEIAKVLEVSRDSAYRRMRGEKILTFEDLQKLSATFRISIDRFLHEHSSSFIFSGKLAYDSADFPVEYLNNMQQQFDYILSFPQQHIYILPNDIPPFIYFQFPELAAFTFFYYKRSLLNYTEMKELKFSVKDINVDHIKHGKKVLASFNKLPSTEIWGIDIINSVLRHISFYRDTRIFSSREDIVCLYDKLNDLIAHIEKQAELGYRFTFGESPINDPAPYRMFHNDVITGDNCVLAKIGNSKITYINHNLINFMFTRDDHFNNYTLDTFENAIQKSTQISQVGEKARVRFFDRLRRKISEQRAAVGDYS